MQGCREVSWLTFSVKVIYLIYLVLANFIWLSDRIEVETQLEAAPAVLPLCWWRRFAGYITENEGGKKERRKGRNERRSLGHHGKMKAPQLDGWEESWEMGKEKSITLARDCKAADFGNGVLFTEQCFERGSAWYEHSVGPQEPVASPGFDCPEQTSKRGIWICQSAALGPVGASVLAQCHWSRVRETLGLS